MQKYIKRSFIVLIILHINLLSLFGQTNSVRINEFVAVNQSGLTDATGAYSDWIELYNPTNSNVDLLGWHLTDKLNEPMLWTFPSVVIPANGYMVVFASGNNLFDPNGELHTNFKLSGDGEYLALLNIDGTVVNEFNPFPALAADQSYGYLNGAWIFYNEVTPGAENSSTSTAELPLPVFSRKHGFYNSSFNLELTSTVPGATIRYTLNGSEPTLSNGISYTSSLNISTTSIVRAMAFVAGGAKSQVLTQTYLFPDDVIRQPNNPEGYPSNWGAYVELAGKAVADYEMDQEMMDDPVMAQRVKDALIALPVMSLVTDKDHLFSPVQNENTGGIYMYTGSPGREVGKGWERPVSMEYFDAKDSVSVQVNCGISIHGGHSRRPEKSPKHSFRLLFKSKYGPGRFNFPLFGYEAARDFNSLVLRSAYGNTWIHLSADERDRALYGRDTWSKDTQGEMGHPASRSIFVHLYINGIYWGIYSPGERLDSDYAESYFGGDADDYDVMKDYSEVANGTRLAWDKMIGMANSGLTSAEAYQKILGNNPDGTPNPGYESYVNVENLIDYMLINFYGGNTDWDHHNWVAIRNRVNPDKGFRFFCWDQEHVLKSTSENTVNKFNSGCPSNVFQRMKENEDFRRSFADRALLHLTGNGLLTPDANRERWMKRSSELEKAIDAESARWGDYRRDVHRYQESSSLQLYTKDSHWIPARNWLMNTYFEQRTDIVLSQLRNAGLYPNIDGPEFLLNSQFITKKEAEKGDVLSMSAPLGTIYYTLNGTDPVLWQSKTAEVNVVEFVKNDAVKKVLVPKADIGNDWYSSLDFNVSNWTALSGSPGGVGYERTSGYQEYISYDVTSQMHSSGTNPNNSCYIRIPFNVNSNELENLTNLQLLMRYDDGFVAYLNGVKVASANAPATLQWNSAATNGIENDGVVTFDITAYLNLIKPGENLLAIQGFNNNTGNSDFLILASMQGSDQPSGGNVSEDALQYTGPITLEESLQLNARAFHNGEWSAMRSQFLIVPDNYYFLKITEIHYNPNPDGNISGNQFEFIELKNTGNSPIDLTGLKFIKGIEYEFTNQLIIQPSGFIVLATSVPDFYNRYGFAPFDNFKGQLNNGGEEIILVSPTLDTLIAITYSDTDGWPLLADGRGYSLVPVEINPSNLQTLSTDWRASYYIDGSPGKDDVMIVGTDEISLSNKGAAVELRNYPNPFSSHTYIDYLLPDDAYVEVAVYNMMGNQVKKLVQAQQSAGLNQVEWDGTDSGNNALSGGVYIYRMFIQSSGKTEVYTRKMLLMR